MKKLIGIVAAVAALLGVCAGARAQGTLYSTDVRTTAGPIAPGATVTVCSYSAGNYTGLAYTGPIPCSPTVAVYYDAALSQAQSNPLAANYRGEISFYAQAGTYTVTQQGPGLVSKGFAIVLACAPSSTNAGCGSSGGSGPCVTQPYSIQFNNPASQFGCGGLTTDAATQQNLYVAGLETVAGDLATAGPRPHIDVTAPPYYAVGNSGAYISSGTVTGGNPVIGLAACGPVPGNGIAAPGAGAGGTLYIGTVTGYSGGLCYHIIVSPTPSTTVGSPAFYYDDTIAITNAINAACASTIGGVGSKPVVYFPPGTYGIADPDGIGTTPQLPSCAGLQMSGPEAGVAVILATHIGTTSPGSGPVISAPTNSSYRNLTLSGYNQALTIPSGARVSMTNVGALTTVATGLTDNAPLLVTGSFEVNWNGGYISSNQLTVPNFILRDSSGTPPYLIDFENLALGIGPDIVQEVAACVALPSQYIFKNIVRESANDDFLTFNQTGSYGCAYNGLDLEQINDADNTDANAATISFDQPNGDINSATIKYALGNAQVALRNVASARPPANLTVSAGYELANKVVDSSGNPVGSNIATEEAGGGRDHINVASDIYTRGVPIAAAFSPVGAIGDRWFKNGAGYSTLGIDGNFGMLLADGTTSGYGVEASSNSPGTVDLGFQDLLPPTGFSGVATTGGSLAAGPYNAAVWATTSGSSCAVGVGTISTFAYATTVTLSGSNNAISFSWTLPGASPSAPAGYCFAVGPSIWVPGGGLSNAGVAYYISGGSTATFTYTGQTLPLVGNVTPGGTGFTPGHRFTYDALGIGTTSPAYGLDLGTNSLETAHVPLYVDVNETAAPANPPAGLERWYADNSAHLMSCLTHAGGSCAPSGGGGLSGQTAGQVPIAATATTATSSKPLAGAAAAITTGPASNVANDFATMPGTDGHVADSGILSVNSGYVPEVLTSQQGATALAAPGLADGNGAAHVTSSPYAVNCQTSGTDRATTIVFDAGSSVVNLPSHSGTGCGGGMSFVLIDESGATLTVNRGGSDTINVTGNVAKAIAATSFTLPDSGSANLNNGEAGIWNARVTETPAGSSGGSTTAPVNLTSTVANTASDTSAQQLQELAVPFAMLNAANASFDLATSGYFTTASAQTPTVKIAHKLCTVSGCGSGTVVTLDSYTSGASTASSTDAPWRCGATIGTAIAGSSGQLEVHGNCGFGTGGTTASAAVAQFGDANTSLVSAINLTGSLYLDTFVTFSTNGATANTAVQKITRLAQGAPPAPISLAVSPTAVSVNTSANQTFTVTMSNDFSGQGATASLSGAGCSGATCGTIAGGPLSFTYTAPGSVPSPATVTVTFASIADGTKTTTATVTVTATMGITFDKACNALVYNPSAAPANATCNLTGVSMGDMVAIVCYYSTAGGTVTPSDTLGSAGAADATRADTNTANTQSLYHATAASSATDSPACGSASYSGKLYIVALDFSGLTPTLDQSGNTGFSFGTTVTGPALTTTVANEVILTAGGSSGTPGSWTAGGSATINANAVTSDDAMAVEYQIVSSTGTYTPTFTLGTASSWQTVAGTYH